MRQLFRAVLLATALLAGPAAFANDLSEAPAADAARPAVGAWLGEVSWSRGLVTYVWWIEPNGRFSSGRAGRGPNGGGTWNANGARITLKYDDGFRYEGELREDAYSGSAYRANGRRFGAFAMWRAAKGDGAP